MKKGHWLSCLLEWSVDPIQTGLAQAYQVPVLLLWNICMEEHLNCVPILGASHYVTSLYYYFYHHPHHHYVVLVSITLFFLVLLLNQGWSPPLRLQVSDSITYRIVSCTQSSLSFVVNLFNVFLVWLPNFSLNLLLLFLWLQLLLVQSYISCSTFVVSLHINSLYFSFFSAIFCATFLFCVYPSIPQHWNTFVCTHWVGCVCVCAYHLSVVSMPRALYIE